MTLNNIGRRKLRDRHSAYFKRDLLSYLLLIGPPFVIIFILTFLPVVDSIWMSLWHMNLAMPDANKFIGLGNYIKMFTIDPNFWVIMRNTLVQVFSTVILQVVIGLLLAILFSREVRGMNVARALLIVPMMVTPVVVGVIWRMALNPEYGIINYLLSLLHVPGPDWLGSPSLAMISIILTDVWLSTPFVTIIIIAGISSLPRDPFESAKVDGANAFQSFFYITLPLLKPVIWIAVMFRLIDSFKRFDSIFIMTGGGPGIATETLNLYAYNTAFSYMDTGYASALASFLFIIIAVVSIFTISKVQRGIDA